jgi:hypothetical protein
MAGGVLIAEFLVGAQGSQSTLSIGIDLLACRQFERDRN